MSESHGISGLLGSQEFLDPSANDYLALKRALMNEKASPELLPYETDLVDRLQSRCEQQEAILEDIHADSNEHSSYSVTREAYVESKELANTCIAIELSRIKYMLRSYLRVRLFKIENFVMHCIESEETQEKLSPLERSYAYDYVRLVGTHLKSHVTSKFPEAFSSVTKQASAHNASDMVAVPDVGHHVFARVERDLGEIEFYDDGTTSELVAGDLYILRYKVVRDFLSEGSVVLV
jgi:GINS complex subunit 4